jgi:hypothetical protein
LLIADVRRYGLPWPPLTPSTPKNHLYRDDMTPYRPVFPRIVFPKRLHGVGELHAEFDISSAAGPPLTVKSSPFQPSSV